MWVVDGGYIDGVRVCLGACAVCCCLHYRQAEKPWRCFAWCTKASVEGPVCVLVLMLT